MKHIQKIKNRKWVVKSLGVAILLTSIFSFSAVTAQETISAAGGNAVGSGGTASYSVGQLTCKTYTGAFGSVAEGVQHPFEIFVVEGIEEAGGINLAVSAYPNPTTDNLTLEVKDFEFSNLSFQLYDISGKILQNERITGNRTSIVMCNLMPATYFVKVIQGNKEVKTFKINKN